ncbi:sugar phosphate isomerase/epimerase [Staphylococcus sp. ACRSN]|uniref:sugar phosphate isomerase/epimerase family protein n=1 Tax=Staphylococcus sp. ACRSN TaxID=2918214 RepID=UPI001EF1DAE1|nr:TIM barrel protein [Staphylococcus sp. ACRSN]MCG7339616.1 sugar phosphate isomerase/epimerase [Staphylococcus sp. ACRSN]
MNNIKISGFSDEIASDFTTQLKTVKQLGMNYISLRAIDGKNISQFTVNTVKEQVIPKLQQWEIAVSSIGSPIGKIYIDDESAFQQQITILNELCEIAKILDCKYIRIFSFYIPKDENFDNYKIQVVNKLRQFAEIAKAHNIILLHENEKDIFGDIGRRCKTILDEVSSRHFKAIFDFANFVQCAENPQECYELLAPYVEYIHIKDAVYKDNVNVICGNGDGEIQSILKQFFKNGYSGFLTLEPHLVVFDSIKDLEIEHSTETIQNVAAKDGAEGYQIQYEALLAILKQLEQENV